MTNKMRVFILMAFMSVIGIISCSSDAPSAHKLPATMSVNFLTPATIRAVIVEVTGPGINPPIFANFAVGNDSIASGNLTIPAGTNRRIVVIAMDTAGIITHRADTTVTLVPGANPNIKLWLEPLVGNFGITIAFGGTKLVVPDTSTRRVFVGDIITINGFAVRANGDTIPANALLWASNNLAVATMQANRATFHRAGEATITVSHQGIAVAIKAIVASAPPPPSGVTIGIINIP
jgi:hypothetical protein